MTERSFMTGSRFATLKELMSPEFRAITRELDRITVELGLPDHADVNEERYPWSDGLLSSPAFYAARTWEYPYAVLSGDLQPGMTCADIGCGMTAFTVYLQQVAKCEVTGVDPDIFDAGVRYKGHGVSREFLAKTGLRVVDGGMEVIPLPSESFDRVYCLSVIEHLPPEVARRGIQEMARILKPGGRAIVTVDVNLLSEITRPLDLIWESGLQPAGPLDIRWPVHRLGIFCNGQEPADVFGMTLVKDDYMIETQYRGPGRASEVPLVPASAAPRLRWTSANTAQTVETAAPASQLWRRAARRVKRAARVLVYGS